MKEIILHIVDKTFDNWDGCVIMMIFFGVFIILPLSLLLGIILK